MAQGQKAEGNVIFAGFHKALVMGRRLEQDIVVGQHHALGFSGGSGGIYNGGQIFP